MPDKRTGGAQHGRALGPAPIAAYRARRWKRKRAGTSGAGYRTRGTATAGARVSGWRKMTLPTSSGWWATVSQAWANPTRTRAATCPESGT